MPSWFKNSRMFLHNIVAVMRQVPVYIQTMNNDAIKVKLKSCDYHFLFELQLTFQPTVVITTQF